jgi:NADPH:quinone reductase-like Zn-dependent oxidoreductase
MWLARPTCLPIALALLWPRPRGSAPEDEVFGMTNPDFTGAYAEYAVAAAEMIARKPKSLTFVEAASVPVAAVTAWQALFDEAGLAQGAKVLIHGAAGNAGAYAVQLARMAGLHVIATVRPRNVELVRKLGADIVIDAESEHFKDEVGALDAVIDLVGRQRPCGPLGVHNESVVLVAPRARRAAGESARATADDQY